MQNAGFIFGCGAQGRVVLDILRAQYPERIFYFVDENKSLWKTKINNAEVIGNMDAVLKIESQPEIHVALGNPHLREKIVNKLKGHSVKFLNAIHPSSVVTQSSFIGTGLMIGAGAIINTNAAIGDFCIINTRAIVEHDCIFKNYVCISPGACIGGRVSINEKTFIGSGAILTARIEIGANSIIGMGSVVMRNVNSNILVYGSPAKPIKTIDENYDWTKLL